MLRCPKHLAVEEAMTARIGQAFRRTVDAGMHAVCAVACITGVACVCTSLAKASDLPDKTLVFCSEGSPAGFDPAQYTTGVEFTASGHSIFDQLIEFERGATKIEHALAQSWDVSPDACNTP